MFADKFVPIVNAYIDPGTGSAIIAVAIGLISVMMYGIKGLFVKLISGVRINQFSNNEHFRFVIYTDSKRYWNSFKPICDEFEKRKINVKYYTQSKDDPALNETYNYISTEFIGEGNEGIFKMNYIDANVVLSTTPSLDVYQWKRSKKAKWYVHILHACNDLALYRMFSLDYYDAVLVNGQFQIDQIRQLEELRNLPKKECQLVGLTYFDQLKNKLNKVTKKNNERPVVLLAPSWGPSSILNEYGSILIDRLIDTGYEIVIRPHPQSYIVEGKTIKELMNKYPTIEWNKDNDNFGILNKADILISDFSGVIFDFALVFEKPVMYTNFDFDDSIYDYSWLEGKPWIFRKLPVIGKELNTDNIENIKEIIDGCLKDTKYKDVIERIKEEAWVNPGNAANAIVNYVIKKEEGINH